MSTAISVIAIGALAIGLMFLISAIGVAVFAGGLASRLASRAYARMPEPSCGELERADRLPGRVILRGQVFASPGRNLHTAPLSGQACAWYEVTVNRIYADDDEGAAVQTLWQTSSSTTVALDDRTGVVLVSEDLLGHGIGGAQRQVVVTSWDDHREALVTDRSLPPVPSSLTKLRQSGLVEPAAFSDDIARRSTLALEVTERIVRPGALVAVGTPRRQGEQMVLRPTMTGHSGASRGTVAQVRAHAAAEADDNGGLMRFLVLTGLMLAVPGGTIHALISSMS